MERLIDTPVQVVSDLGDLLAQNAEADALLGTVCQVQGEARNIVWNWFANPVLRELYSEEEWVESGRHLVADLRAAVGRRGADAEARDLVERLRARSPQFATLWAQHEVGVQRSRLIRLPKGQVRQRADAVEYQVETLLTPAADQRLLLFTTA